MLGCFGIPGTFQTPDMNGSGIGPGKPSQDVDGRGFARSIRSEKAEKFSLAHRKGYSVNRNDLVKFFG
jgi:hypothetical protein